MLVVLQEALHESGTALSRVTTHERLKNRESNKQRGEQSTIQSPVETKNLNNILKRVERPQESWCY